MGPMSADASPASAAAEPPLGVTTLELFFDVVFAFTLTQLAALLAGHLARPGLGQLLTGIAQVVLVFGLLWWMYEGYAWLTNARPPVHTTERLMLLVGMAGFLTVGLAIPDGFGHTGLLLGLGYLVVVLVHAGLYFRVNRNILRIAPFNLASALLVSAAGLLHGPGRGETPAGYALWAAALAIQLGSPLITHPRNLFEIRASHFTGRHSALLIVALGESVAAIGIGGARLAGRSAGADGRLLASAVLGLALAGALWWTIFGSGDEEEAERRLAAASSERRTELALSAFFYGNIPLLLGLVAMAAGVQLTISQQAVLRPGPAGVAGVLGCGAALFLAGDAAVRRLMRTGPVRPRAVAAVLALATVGAGVSIGLDAQLALLAAIFTVMLLAGRNPAARPATGTDAAG